VRRWWVKGSGRPIWLKPFTDRVPGRDDFCFDIEYHIEVLGISVSSLDEQRNLCAGAVRAIVEPMLGRYDVLRPAIAEQDVNLCLARSLPLRESAVTIRKCQISLRVDDETVESARRLAKALQDAKADAARREALRVQMKFFQEEVIRDPATLELYIHAAEIDRSDPISPKRITDLRELAHTVMQWKSENPWVLTAQILHDHVKSLHHPDVLALIAALRESISDHEDPRLLKRFDEAHRPPPDPEDTSGPADSTEKGT
jgi:hypothetical protein